MKKLLLLLLSTSAFANSLRTDKSQQFTSANAERNYVKNSGAERNVNNVTIGATMSVTRTTTTPLEGDAEFTVDGAATSDTADFVTDTFQRGLIAQNCEAKFVYEGDASKYTAYVRQGTSNIASLALTNESAPKKASINFPCGDASSATVLRIDNTGTAGAAFTMDSVYVGLATNIGSVSQAQVVGSAYFATTASCLWSRNNAALGAFGTDTDCPGPTVDFQGSAGTIQTTDADLPQITVNGLAAGVYRVVATLPASSSAGTPVVCAALTADAGSSYFGRSCAAGTAGEPHPLTVEGTFNVTAPGNVTFAIHGAAASNSIQITNDGSLQRTSFVIERFPGASELAVRPDQANFGWTAYTPVGTWVSNATYTGKYRRVGESMDVQVKIALTGAPTAAALAVDIPSGFTIDTAKIVDTTGFNVPFGMGAGLLSGAGKNYQVLYSDNNTVAVVYQSALTATQTQVTNAAPASYANGDVITLNFSVPISGWSVNQNAPLLVGSVTSNATGAMKLESIRFGGASNPSSCTSTPCTIYSQTGTWVSGVTRGGTGDYTVTIGSSKFSTVPTCICNAEAPGTGISICAPDYNTVSTTNLRILSTIDAVINIMCMGTN